MGGSQPAVTDAISCLVMSCSAEGRRCRARREGQFSVLSRDPAEMAMGPALFPPPVYEGPTNNAGAYTPPAPADLEEAKALLERCLPRDE